VFSPQSWIKTKTCLAGIRAAIQQYFAMLPSMPGGKELNLKLRTALTMDPGQVDARWAADLRIKKLNLSRPRLRDRIQAQIAKLREYRQAVISAAVTGKMGVPREVPA
jgi:hypothetical protein